MARRPDLPQRLRAGSRRAAESGALVPIGTRIEHVEDGGVRFIVRILESALPKGDAPPGHDPFLPYEEALFVADLSPTHVALLNKFPVVPEHLLLVTRDFEDQDAPLDDADFTAWSRALEGIDGLAFYNGGRSAGASQRHKHLQLVPWMADAGAVPIEAVRPRGPGPAVAAELPFAQAWATLEPAASAPRLREHYEELRRFLAIEDAPYNLLFTRSWMLLVPRSRECFGSVSINALGYAGALLVRDEAEFALLRRDGPMQALAATGLPRR